MPTNTQILISGAGIAGLTLAWWLKAFGFEPTVIEKRPDLCDEGYMIDFFGSGFDVAEKMGLTEALRIRHYPVDRLVSVDREGKTRAAFRIDAFRKLLDYRHFNFMRGDLATVLYESLGARVPVRFNTRVQSLALQPDRVDVELSDGTRQSYDLIIGADGIHSKTRELVWGSESRYERFLGYYVACGIIPATLSIGYDFYSYQEPNHAAMVYPIRGHRLATFFAFRSDEQRPSTRQEELTWLTDVFDGMGWIVPQLLAATKESPHLYFDAVSQIHVRPWHQGRVALVGDACQCLTLLAGQGASMAMAGAYQLATELHQANGDYQVAFGAYQDKLVPEIERRQAQAHKLAQFFVPASQFGIRVMQAYLKVAFLPGLREIFRRQVGEKSIIH